MGRKSKTGAIYRVTGKWPALAALAAAILVLAALATGAGRAAQTAARPAKHPIYSVDISEKKVALGINCAWGNEDIEQILEILGHYNIRASFFVVGEWCGRYPGSVKMIFDAGHEIGSHSDTHADMTKLTREGVLREIRDSAAKIAAITGKAPTLFRPPSGAYNSEVIGLVEGEGLFPIQWDCDSLDYKNPTPAAMKRRIFKTLRPGSILLFHSGTKNTAAALPEIIEAIHGAGYAFVPVSELIYPRPYTVDFEGRQRAAAGHYT